MLASEFSQFEALIRRLEKLYGKRVDDDLMQTYWQGLRDVHIGVVRERVEQHIKRAKFFPKPVELRPREKPERGAEAQKSDQDFARAVEQSIRDWDERLRAQPLETKWMLLEAYLARIDAEHPPSSLIHAEKLEWAKRVCERLLSESGQDYPQANFPCWRTLMRLMPREALRQETK